MKLIKYISSFIIELIFIIVLLLAATNVRADQFLSINQIDLAILAEYDFSEFENNKFLDNDFWLESDTKKYEKWLIVKQLEVVEKKRAYEERWKDSEKWANARIKEQEQRDTTCNHYSLLISAADKGWTKYHMIKPSFC